MVTVWASSVMSAWTASSTSFARKTLESHKLGALGERGGVEREGHVNGAVGGLGSEGRLCGDLLAVHDKRLLGDVALIVSAP